jgi:NTE family protein
VPVTDEHGRQLVDGGLVAVIPSVAARGLGTDIVIAVDVNAEGARFLGPPQSAIGIIFQAMLLVQRAASQHHVQAADFVIRPKVGHIRWDEMARAEELIVAGYQAASESIQAIQNLIKSATVPTPKVVPVSSEKTPRTAEQEPLPL